MGSRHRCECGRPAVAIQKRKKKSGKKTLAGKPVHVKDHDLCISCNRRDRDSRCGRAAG